MSNENYTLNIYNPATGQVEVVPVPKGIYDEFRRSNWNIDKNNDRFRKHETPFTDLRGGMDGSYENFDEFRREKDDPAQLVVDLLMLRDLRQALARLDESERDLLRAIFSLESPSANLPAN